MAVAGERTTLYTGAVLPARIKIDMADEIINVEAGYNNEEAPFFTLSQNINKKRIVHNPKYNCLEDTYNVRQGTARDSVGYNSTTIAISTIGSWVMAGSLLYAPLTGEVILAGAVSTTHLTSCVRNVGGSISALTGQAEGSGAALASLAVLVHIGDTFPEGTTAPSAITTQTEESYNFTSIEKTTVDLSDTLMNTDLHGESNDEAYQLKKKAIEHKFKIERQLFMSNRSIRQDGTSGTARRTTAGVLQHIKGNVLDISGAAYGGILTAKVLDEFIEKAFMNGSSTKYLFCGMKFASACDAMMRNHYRQVDSKKTAFGTIMKEYSTSNGTLRIVVAKKLFEYEATIRGTAVCVDMPYVRYCALQNRDTQLRKGIKDENNDGYDGRKSEYLTEFGLDMRGWGLDNSNAASTGDFRGVHGKITGFTGY